MMNRSNHVAADTPMKLWMKRLSWALPLLFLAKGLAWLALPILLAAYGLN